MASIDEVFEQATAAAESFRKLSQEQTDAIVNAAYLAAYEAREDLAKMAQEESMLGIWQHKAEKNVIATKLVYEDIENQKTVGIISEDKDSGISEIAAPRGVILALTPVTNPTATVLHKALISLKTRNALVISPHNAAKRAIAEAARICYEAALAAGAPEHCIQWRKKSTPKSTEELLAHPKVDLILATGPPSIVRKASSTGKAVIGVGPGNVPALISDNTDAAAAVASIMESKTFDYGTVCASEQAVVVPSATAERVKEAFKKEGAHFLSVEEIEKLSSVAIDPERGGMSAAVVGQSPEQIAGSAGIEIPAGTTLLVAELEGVGREYPLSAEILAPILAFYVEEDFEACVRRSASVVAFGGKGHTAVIYSSCEEQILHFAHAVDAGRILIDTPATQGALGGTHNALPASFSLGSGTGGDNIFSDNITARHLLNIYRIARKRR